MSASFRTFLAALLACAAAQAAPQPYPTKAVQNEALMRWFSVKNR